MKKRGIQTKRVVEWLGAIVSFPMSDLDDEPPEGVFWMGADGALLGAQAFPRGEAVASACTSLAYTMEAPESGDPHRPTRVRVASAELADALRVGFPNLEVVCAPTPELDAVIAGMHEAFERHTKPETFALAGLGHEAVSTFFATAAALYRTKPWKVVPSDQHVFESQPSIFTAACSPSSARATRVSASSSSRSQNISRRFSRSESWRPTRSRRFRHTWP